MGDPNQSLRLNRRLSWDFAAGKVRNEILLREFAAINVVVAVTEYGNKT